MDLAKKESSHDWVRLKSDKEGFLGQVDNNQIVEGGRTMGVLLSPGRVPVHLSR